MLNKETTQGFNNNRGYYQGQGSGSGQGNQWNRQENFNNNQARQQQKEPILSNGQRLSSIEALVTNMGASMKNMETKIGQIT